MKLGIQNPPMWLSSSTFALISVEIVSIWRSMGYNAIIFLAGLQGISGDLYEAAQIDGASPFQRFRFITLPFVRVVVGLLIILRTIWIFNSFDLIFLLTGGGPGTSTETVPIFAYRMGWTLYSLGRSSAVTILLLLFLTAACLIILRYWTTGKRRWRDESETA